jgi:hypothetical protein
LELGRADEALAALDHAEVPKSGSWAVLRARAHWMNGDETQAVELLSSASEAGNRAAADLLSRLEVTAS